MLAHTRGCTLRWLNVSIGEAGARPAPSRGISDSAAEGAEALDWHDRHSQHTGTYLTLVYHFTLALRTVVRWFAAPRKASPSLVLPTDHGSAAELHPHRPDWPEDAGSSRADLPCAFMLEVQAAQTKMRQGAAHVYAMSQSGA